MRPALNGSTDLLRMDRFMEPLIPPLAVYLLPRMLIGRICAAEARPGRSDPYHICLAGRRRWLQAPDG
ncbi:hypothetical protein MHYP_G00242370 [Metynnis hypsauchen]